MSDLFTGGGSGPTAPGPLPPISQTPGYPGVPGVGSPVPNAGPGGLPTYPGALPAAGGGGGGSPWYQNPQLLGAILSGASGLWGAYNQNQTNNQNFDAQQQQLQFLNARQGMVTDYVNQFLQPGQNPYSASILQMLGASPTAPAGGAGAVPAAALSSAPAAAPTMTAAPATRPAALPGSANRRLSPPGATDVNPYLPATGNPQVGVAPSQQVAGFNLPAFQAPQDISSSIASSPAFNMGQDSLMQMLRAGPNLGQASAGLGSIINHQGNQYDNSGLFSAIDMAGENALNQQVAQLQGSFGSFGSRLGSSAMNAQANLRNNYLLGANLQKQQIGAQSFNDAQARLMQALGLSSQNALSAYGAQAGVGSSLGNLGLGQSQLLAQIAQANQGAQQNYNQFQLGALGQANAIQQAQSGQNLGLLSLLAGLPMGQAPVAQPSALPGAIGDISQLALLYPYLRRS